MAGPFTFLGALALLSCCVLGVVWFCENVTIKRKPKSKR